MPKNIFHIILQRRRSRIYEEYVFIDKKKDKKDQELRQNKEF